MAINQNHLFEELNGVKCAIVEKNVSAERVGFLRLLLEHNGFTVMTVSSPPPKTAPAAAAPVTPATPAAAVIAAAEEQPPAAAPPPPPPETFTVGVTDVMFNPINAIFGRLLKTPDGHIVTLAYWQQKETYSRDDVPYFNK